MLKQIKWGAIGLAAAEIAAGILLVMFPALSSDVICYLVGVGACIYGVINLVQYFFMKLEDSLYRNEFVIGVMALLFGMIIMLKKNLIIDLIPVVLGMIIVLSGFIKFQRAVVAFRIRYDKAVYYACLGFISIIIGIVIMFVLGPQQTQELIFLVIGSGLIYCGVSDLITILFLAGKFHKYIQDFEEGRIDLSEPEDTLPEAQPEPVIQPEPEPVTEPEPEPLIQPEPLMEEEDAIEPELILPEDSLADLPSEGSDEITLILPDEEEPPREE